MLDLNTAGCDVISVSSFYLIKCRWMEMAVCITVLTEG